MTGRLLPLVVLLGGCPGRGSVEKEDVVIYVADENNYAYSGSVAIGSIETQMGVDLTFHWDELTSDIQGHAVSSCDEIDSTWIVWFQYLTLPELEEKITCVDIAGSDADVAAYQDPPEPDGSDCQVKMSELSIPPSNPFHPEEYYTTDAGVWFSRVTTGTARTRMLVQLLPSDTSTNTDVSFRPDTSALTFSADLHDLTRPVVAAEALSWTFDWSTLLAGANSEGCDPTDPTAADQFWLARYDGMSVDDLEAEFLDLELLADEVWTTDAGAVSSINLADAVSTTDGSTLEAFDPDATWIMALRCTYCENPAPLFLTVLDVE